MIKFDHFDTTQVNNFFQMSTTFGNNYYVQLWLDVNNTALSYFQLKPNFRIGP